MSFLSIFKIVNKVELRNSGIYRLAFYTLGTNWNFYKGWLKISLKNFPISRQCMHLWFFPSYTPNSSFIYHFIKPLIKISKSLRFSICNLSNNINEIRVRPGPALLLESSPHLCQLSSWKPSDLQAGFKELNQDGNQKQIRNCNKKQVIHI